MSWLAGAATCVIAHHLLAYHYQDACRPSWLFADPKNYCAFLERVLQALRAAPLLPLLALPDLRGALFARAPPNP